MVLTDSFILSLPYSLVLAINCLLVNWHPRSYKRLSRLVRPWHRSPGTQPLLVKRPVLLFHRSWLVKWKLSSCTAFLFKLDFLKSLMASAISLRKWHRIELKSILCVGALSLTCMFVPTCIQWTPQRSRKKAFSLQTQIRMFVSHLVGAGRLNPSPLQEN